MKQILERLQKDQRVSSTELMKEFEVSEGTIRRDLNELEDRGLLRKVHGGAVPRPEAPRVYESRKEFASDRKAALARRALPLLKDGQLILIDGGSTNWHLAKAMPADLKATVFTNSIPVAQALMDHPNIELHVLGGKIFKASQVTVGIQIVDFLRNIRADLCFIGVRSIHHELGLTTLEMEEARVKRTIAEVSDRVVVMATRDKLGTVDHFKICDFKDIDLMITEPDTPEEALKAYRNMGVEIW